VGGSGGGARRMSAAISSSRQKRKHSKDTTLARAHTHTAGTEECVKSRKRKRGTKFECTLCKVWFGDVHALERHSANSSKHIKRMQTLPPLRRQDAGHASGETRLEMTQLISVKVVCM